MMIAPLLLIACTSQSDKSATTPTTIRSPGSTLTSGAAARYNDPIEPPSPSALGDAVVAAAREAAAFTHAQAPVGDARLSRACAALAGVAREGAGLEYQTVEFAFQSNGIVEPSPHMLLVWGDLHDRASILDSLHAKLTEIVGLGQIAHIGVGTFETSSDGTGAVVVALQESHVRTSPIPRSVEAAAHFAFDGELADGYHDPIVRLQRPTGEVERVDVRAATANAFHTDIDCGSAIGKMQIEISGHSARGLDVLANFPVWCGSEPPRSLAVGQRIHDVPASPQDAEQRMFGLVNADRQRAGLAPLVWDADVAALARAHSEEVRQADSGTNNLPASAGLQKRVRAMKGHVSAISNQARAYGIAEAHRGLLELPSTRAPLMSASATRIGIGIVYGGVVGGMREMFITELVMAPAP